MKILTKFDVNTITPQYRYKDEWREIFTGAQNELFLLLGVDLEFVAGTKFSDDEVGNNIASEAARIKGIFPWPLHLELCGLMFATIQFDEYAHLGVDLLLFSNGKRLKGSKKMDLLHCNYTSNGWGEIVWGYDEHYEWDNEETNVAWKIT